MAKRVKNPEPDLQGMRWMPLLLAAALVLAGCGGKKSSPDDPIVVPDVAAGKGAIRGLVLDPALTPVAGAQVQVVGSERTTETGADGAFVFVDLEPGPYFVKAAKPGWTEVQQSVEVVADDNAPPILKVLIERIPGAEPAVDTQKFEGFISCSIGTPATFHDCNTLDEQYSSFYIDMERPPSWIQTEIVWDSTQPAGDWLYVIQGFCVCDGGFPDFPERFNETNSAQSPYITRVGPDLLESMGAGTERRQLVVDVSASGPEPETTNGSGVALNQEFTLYVTFFYNLEPAADWVFIEDGDHPVPEV